VATTESPLYKPALQGNDESNAKRKRRCFVRICETLLPMQNPPNTKKSYALATSWVCGALPLTLGTAVFLVWFVTGWGWWERAWMWLIGLAILCLLVGAAALTRHVSQTRAETAAAAGRKRGAVLAGLLLFLNIPVGVALMMLVVSIITRHVVEVVNLSNAPIESLVLTGPGVESLEIGPVAPQQRARKALRFTSEGKLAYAARHNGSIHTGILEASASPNGGGGSRLQITPQGDWVIGNRWAP
jgi:hypothetical protein